MPVTLSYKIIKHKPGQWYNELYITSPGYGVQKIRCSNVQFTRKRDAVADAEAGIANRKQMRQHYQYV